MRKNLVLHTFCVIGALTLLALKVSVSISAQTKILHTNAPLPSPATQATSTASGTPIQNTRPSRIFPA
jgi:hypothetical protein